MGPVGLPGRAIVNPLTERLARVRQREVRLDRGDVALRALPRGGVFLAGGIPPRLTPVLDTPLFRDAFVKKGRFSEALASIRVEIVLDPAAPLTGATHVAFARWEGEGRTALPWGA